MTNVYIIRHGTTDSNESGIFQGQQNIPLSTMGVKQVSYLSEWAKSIPLDAVYTSPLLRTQQTADAVCKFTDLIPTKVDGLMEISGGILEGKDGHENNKNFPEQMENLRSRPAYFHAPEGETARAVYDRMIMAINTIAKENPGKTVAVVSHGFAIQLFLGFAKQVPFETIERYIVGNASVSLVTYDDNGNFHSLEYINDESHLPIDVRFQVAKNFMT